MKNNNPNRNNTTDVTMTKYLRFRMNSQIKIGIEVNLLDIQGCHRVPFGRNATNTTKRVMVKLVNRKHSEAMLQRKKDINKKSKVFFNRSLCPYYRFLWGKSKELQSKSWVNQVFCHWSVVTVRITENSPAIKILNEKNLTVCQECPP